jgi:hypothetical protein
MYGNLYNLWLVTFWKAVSRRRGASLARPTRLARSVPSASTRLLAALATDPCAGRCGRCSMVGRSVGRSVANSLISLGFEIHEPKSDFPRPGVWSQEFRRQQNLTDHHSVITIPLTSGMEPPTNYTVHNLYWSHPAGVFAYKIGAICTIVRQTTRKYHNISP